MAEVVQTMPVRRSEFWPQYFDGKKHRLTEGQDYRCTTRKMANRARAAAHRRGLNVTVRESQEHKHITIEAHL